MAYAAWMRWGWVLLIVSCAPARHVYVPERSHACWRECKAMYVTCMNHPRGDIYSLAAYCEDQRLDCNLTCPGARETTPKD